MLASDLGQTVVNHVAQHDRRSPRAASYRHLYKTEAWQIIRRRAFVRDGGICHICHKLIIGRYDGDHVIAHNGDHALFFSVDNVKPAHPTCHASAKQSEERTGYSKAMGEDGWPTDPAHPANRSV
jgi:5-methylcytosine-specific restriction enzyme A